MLAVQALAALLELDAHAGLYHLLQPGNTAPLGRVQCCSDMGKSIPSSKAADTSGWPKMNQGL